MFISTTDCWIIYKRTYEKQDHVILVVVTTLNKRAQGIHTDFEFIKLIVSTWHLFRLSMTEADIVLASIYP